MNDIIQTIVMIIVTNTDGTFPQGFEYVREHQGTQTCADIMDEESAFLSDYGNEGDAYCIEEFIIPRQEASP